jgi:hypothetical protein
MKSLKIMTLTTAVAMTVMVFALISAAARVKPAHDFDAAGTFKAKCQVCHGPAAENGDFANFPASLCGKFP